MRRERGRNNSLVGKREGSPRDQRRLKPSSKRGPSSTKERRGRNAFLNGGKVKCGNSDPGLGGGSKKKNLNEKGGKEILAVRKKRTLDPQPGDKVGWFKTEN